MKTRGGIGRLNALLRSPSATRWVRVPTTLFALSLLIAAIAVMSDPVRAQDRSGFQGMDFRVPLEYYPVPNETQVKTLLEGAKAQPLSGGRIQLTAATLKTFNTNGTLYLVAATPECVFNSADRTVSSAGALKVKTADGKFQMEGVGFLLRTNLVLSISNQVHAVF